MAVLPPRPVLLGLRTWRSRAKFHLRTATAALGRLADATLADLHSACWRGTARGAGYRAGSKTGSKVGQTPANYFGSSACSSRSYALSLPSPRTGGSPFAMVAGSPDQYAVSSVR